MPTCLTIENDNLSLELAPETGATITKLRAKINDSWVDIMRPAPEPLGRSSNGNFIMAPYSNRIKDARFVFRGTEHRLENPEKHAIHGDVRDRPWEVCEVSDSHAVLELSSPGFPNFNFPFPLQATITYLLEGATFSCKLEIKNLGTKPFPVGGGFHPYFKKELNVPNEIPELQFTSGGVYLYSGELPLPEGPMSDITSQFSFSDSRPLPEGLDHCFGAWNGKAVINWPKAKTRLEFSASPEMSHVIVFSPPGQNFFAFEPATMATDGFNALESGQADTGVAIIEAEQTFSASYRATVVRC